MLCGGDITKRDWILSNIEIGEIQKFIEYKTREFLMMEVILNFAGVKNQPLEKKINKFKFCSACRKAHKNKNCSSCKGFKDGK